MILLTGGTGFIGSSLVSILVKEGHRVRCLVRSPQKAAKLTALGAETVEGDITKPETLPRALQGMAFVIHLVGIIQEKRGATFEGIHHQGTQNLLNVCREPRFAIRKFIHISALGAGPDAESLYHQTKWQAEEAVRGSGLRHTIFRPSLVFGKRSEFFKLLKTLVTLPPVIPVVGNGQNKFQPVAVKDVAKCFMKALDNPDSDNQTFEMGGPEQFTYDALLDLIVLHFRKQKPKVHLPIAWMKPIAWLNETLLPKPLLTLDQLSMLQKDNICDNTPLMRVFALKLQNLRESLAEMYS